MRRKEVRMMENLTESQKVLYKKYLAADVPEDTALKYVLEESESVHEVKPVCDLNDSECLSCGA